VQSASRNVGADLLALTVQAPQGALSGLLKNTAQLFTLFDLANLVLARRLNPSSCA